MLFQSTDKITYINNYYLHHYYKQISLFFIFVIDLLYKFI